jgi:2'-5' RNA ligase
MAAMVQMASSSRSTDGFRKGETALIVRAPETEPAVGAWRERFDPSTPAGIPAHLTVLHPFLPEERLNDRTLRQLARVLGRHEAFDVSLDATGRFPGVLYLAPSPARELQALTRSVAARWPEVPPYGGRFAEVIPHLTVAQSDDAAAIAAIESALLRLLPITVRVSTVELLVCDGVRWQPRAAFRLGARGV